MKAELTYDTLKMPVSRRGRSKGAIAHYDRGSQNNLRGSRNLLKNSELQQGMVPKWNYWNIDYIFSLIDSDINTRAESFFHLLKVKAIHGQSIMDKKTMR